MIKPSLLFFFTICLSAIGYTQIEGEIKFADKKIYLLDTNTYANNFLYGPNIKLINSIKDKDKINFHSIEYLGPLNDTIFVLKNLMNIEFGNFIGAMPLYLYQPYFGNPPNNASYHSPIADSSNLFIYVDTASEYKYYIPKNDTSIIGYPSHIGIIQNISTDTLRFGYMYDLLITTELKDKNGKWNYLSKKDKRENEKNYSLQHIPIWTILLPPKEIIVFHILHPSKIKNLDYRLKIGDNYSNEFTFKTK